MFKVITQAPDRALLTVAELRALAGLDPADSSKDTDLQSTEQAVTELLTDEMNVAEDGIKPATILSEVVSDTIRIRRGEHISDLVLSRRYVTAVASIVEGDTTLTEDDYEVLPSSGIITRIKNGNTVCWRHGTVVVTYTAGFDAPPAKLKQAVKRVITTLNQSGDRDPNLKEEQIDGVGTWTYWVQPTTQSIITADIEDLIASYRSPRRLA